jgi:hypothetical protein
MLQLDREDGMVPASLFSQLVVRQNVGSDLDPRSEYPDIWSGLF